MSAAAVERRAGAKTWGQDSDSPAPTLRREQRRSARELLIPAGLNLEVLMACERQYIHFFLFSFQRSLAFHYSQLAPSV